MKKEMAVGVDIGGTKISCGLVDREGVLLRRIIVPTPSGSSAIMDRVADGIERLLEEEDGRRRFCLKGIGVGSAGQIDFAAGAVRHAVDTIPGWTGTDIRGPLSARFELPVYVDNDVNAIALSEKWFGAGRQYRHFICLALGTGVGGAIVDAGRIVRGSFGGAGEFGHMSVDFNGPRCSCGNYGCLELYASGTGIARIARETVGEGAIGLGSGISSHDVIRSWRNGEEWASRVMDTVVRALCTAISGMIHALNPQAVIIGGGIAEAGSILFDALLSGTETRTSGAMWSAVRLLPAASGVDAGIMGAAVQAWEYG